MAKQPQRGAPKKPLDKAKGELIQIRVSAAEKEAFRAAADQDGKKISEWIRDRLRGISKTELQAQNKVAAFLVDPKG